VPRELFAVFAAIGAEFRVSVSAFDTDAQLSHRLDLLRSYQAAGGVAIPLVMTTCFARSEMSERQEWLVDHVIQQDLPSAENSLRFHPMSPMLPLLDSAGLRPILNTNDLWSGRLFPNLLRVPTTTSVPSTYEGLQSNYLSHNDPEFLMALFCEPVHTHEEVLAGPPLDKPRQCGVAVQAAGAKSLYPVAGGAL
jgi:hypothetical protein